MLSNFLGPHLDTAILASFEKRKLLYEVSREKMETKIISGLELGGVRAKITSPSHLIREIMVYLHNCVYAHGCFLAIPVFMVYECL